VAEFIDVIHTIQRICKKNEGQCSVCILGEYACPNNARFDKTEEAAFRELEDAVVEWAEENPEPVYPTWEEWLQSIGVMESSEGLLRRIQGQLLIDGIPAHAVPTSKVLRPMDADIAQKLGIEPKEG
jgi:hypothetical protein